MPYLTIVSWDANNRPTKFQPGFETLADAEAHAATYGGFAVEDPGTITRVRDYVVDPVAETIAHDPEPVVKPTVITFLAFLKRFTEAEHEAVITWMRTAHPKWEAAFERAKAREKVDLEDPKTSAFMGQLVTDSVITQSRSDEILTP